MSSSSGVQVQVTAPYPRSSVLRSHSHNELSMIRGHLVKVPNHLSPLLNITTPTIISWLICSPCDPISQLRTDHSSSRSAWLPFLRSLEISVLKSLIMASSSSSLWPALSLSLRGLIIWGIKWTLSPVWADQWQWRRGDWLMIQNTLSRCRISCAQSFLSQKPSKSINNNRVGAWNCPGH